MYRWKSVAIVFPSRNTKAVVLLSPLIAESNPQDCASVRTCLGVESGNQSDVGDS
jgi:hypothetical protein